MKRGIPPRLISRTTPYPRFEEAHVHSRQSDPRAVRIEIVVLIALGFALIWSIGHPCVALGKTVNASMYGGKGDSASSRSLHDGFGKATKYRNVIALRSTHFGDLYQISHKRHGKWYTGLYVQGDYGPASWTGKYVDILWGGAKRLSLPGTGHVRIVKVGHLPRSKWRKFTYYRSLRECKRKLRWK